MYMGRILANLNSADNSTNVSSESVTKEANSQVRDRQIDAIMKLVPKLDEALSYLQLI